MFYIYGAGFSAVLS